MTTATQPRRRALSLRYKLYRAFFFFLGLLLLAYCLIILPQAWAYVHKIQTISAESVESVSITRIQQIGDKIVQERLSLPTAQIPRFVELVAQAKSCWPNHPRADHKYFVEIKLTSSPVVIGFEILTTTNIGTLIYVWSDGIDQGWHYGTLQVDDEVRQIIEAIPFRKQ